MEDLITSFHHYVQVKVDSTNGITDYHRQRVLPSVQRRARIKDDNNVKGQRRLEG